jgi:outer membrane protein assembly factor BamB
MAASPDLLFVGAGKYIQGLDRATGRPIWQRKLPSSMWSAGIVTLLAEGNELFVGRNGYVYCLDARTGEVLWERGVGTSSGWAVMLATRGTSSNGSVHAQHASMAAAQQAASVAAMSAATAAAAS